MNKFRGRHLIVDAYGVESSKLRDKKMLSRLLEDLPKKLRMRILRRPIVGEISSEMYPTTGLSGFVILYESHVSFHTWPEENFIALDVYSCKDFEDKNAISCIQKYLGAKRLKTKSIIRG